MDKLSRYSTPAEVNAKLSTLRSTFQRGVTKDLRWRKWQLKQLYWLVEDNEDAIKAALKADLGRHEYETTTSDIGLTKSDCLLHIRQLERWTADETPADSGFFFGRLATTVIRKEPRGVVLIIGAWNFPVLLVLEPLVAALAAGCAALLKPSETTPACEKLISELIPRYLDTSAVAVVTGGPQETGHILKQPFDHVFFTGSPAVGKIVARAAAEHLTPTVLELGGQAPDIVTASANVDLAAKQIVYSKFQNSGQVCLSSNHTFVDPEVHDRFMERVGYWVEKWSAGDFNTMSAIVNEKNYERIKSMLDKTKGRVVTKGSFDKSRLRIPITVIDEVDMSDSVLESEIFGPLLPVVSADYKTAVREINALPHPLGIYIFSNSKDEVEYILNNTLSGGVTVNDCLMHAASPDAPFGGVGGSGSGSYHGKYGFDAFTHKRTVVTVPAWLDKIMSIRYPPYTLENARRLAVKNSLGFKRGERLEDQKIARPGRTKTVAKAVLYSAVFVLVLTRQPIFRPAWLQPLTEVSDGLLRGLLRLGE